MPNIKHTFSQLIHQSSLRARFFSVMVLTGVILIVSTIIAQLYVSEVSRQTSHNIKDRNDALQHSKNLRNALRNAEDTLDNHLLAPAENYKTYWRQYIQLSLIHLDRLEQNNWVKIRGFQNEIAAVRRDLQSMDKLAQELMDLRFIAEIQHPSLHFARETMLPMARKFITDAALAIEETLEDDIAEDNLKIYDLFNQTRYLWIQLISSFRMYIINRIGSFDEGSLAAQENDIQLMYEQVSKQLSQLQELADQEILGIQGSSSTEGMLKAAKSWMADFEKVKKINSSEAWRTDIVFKTTKLRPISEDLLDRLYKLEQEIEHSAANDVSYLSKMGDNIVNTLWLMSILGLSLISIGYIYFERGLLRPIAMVVKALKSEATGGLEVEMPAVQTRETQDLVVAFSEMRKQVHIRQLALEHQAMHDSLTGLPNRILLQDRLQQAIYTSKRHQQTLALLMMDLDRFKEINDTLGHQVGDKILQQAGQRLSHSLRQSDTMGRLGGDEFAILLPETNIYHAIKVGKKILESLENVFEVDGHNLYIGGSIGIALFPEHGDNAETLLQRADVAMYVAKRSKTGYRVYDTTQDEHSAGRLALATDLRHALAENQLQLYYQPRLQLSDKTIMGVEALLRWNHPTYGFIPPDEIVSLAEHTALIKPLTQWVLTTALRQCALWQKSGLWLRMAVNLSVVNVQDYGLIKQVQQQLELNHLDPEILILEITESAMMSDRERAGEILRSLDEMGVQISVDDYGTGFSSLAYLKQLPVDELKIDKSFILNIHSNDNDAVIVRSTIDLARNLGLKVVAEGVESTDTLDLLAILGCDAVQGFLIAKPHPPLELETWLHSKEHHYNITKIVSNPAQSNTSCEQ